MDESRPEGGPEGLDESGSEGGIAFYDRIEESWQWAAGKSAAAQTAAAGKPNGHGIDGGRKRRWAR